MKDSNNIKQRLINSFKEINIHIFVEFGRIKKPQKIAFIIGRMLCLLANGMREKPLKDDFTQWSSIQAFISASVNKFSQEVLNIKNRVLENSPLVKLESLIHIRDTYFPDQAQFQQLLNQSSDRVSRILLTMIWNVVAYVL